jgi:hypothetical protein
LEIIKGFDRNPIPSLRQISVTDWKVSIMNGMCIGAIFFYSVIAVLAVFGSMFRELENVLERG